MKDREFSLISTGEVDGTLISVPCARNTAYYVPRLDAKNIVDLAIYRDDDTEELTVHLNVIFRDCKVEVVPWEEGESIGLTGTPPTLEHMVGGYLCGRAVSRCLFRDGPGEGCPQEHGEE